MKLALTLIVAALLAVNVNAQSLIPVSPEEAQVARISQAADAAKYYGELYAQALGRLHSEVFIADDELLSLVLTRIGQAGSVQLLALYDASVQGINGPLAATGSSVRAPTEHTRTWTWDGANAVVQPLPTPAPEPSPTLNE